MYKSSSAKLNHLGRTGSASTRGAANGRLALPRSAAQAEEYFNSIRHRYDRISSMLAEARKGIKEIDLKLDSKPPSAEAGRLRHKRNEYADILPDLEREYARYGLLAKVAALDAFGATFYEIARRKMDPVLFNAITYETQMMLERAPDAGIVVTSAPKREPSYPDRKRKGRQMSREEAESLRAGRIRAGGGTLVWSDERDLQTEAAPAMR